MKLQKLNQQKPTAIIIKGNPEIINRKQWRTIADYFYNELKELLEEIGYEVQFDAGEPYTEPPQADLWIGHSRGADRLRFAPTNTKTIAIGSSLNNAVNHPDDYSAHTTGSKEEPPLAHFELTQSMEKELIAAIRG